MTFLTILIAAFSFIISWIWAASYFKKEEAKTIEKLQKEIIFFFKGKTTVDIKTKDSYFKKNKEILKIIDKLYKSYVKKTTTITEKDKVIAGLEKSIENMNALFKELGEKPNSGIYKLSSLYADFMLVQYKYAQHFLLKKDRPAKVESRRIRELRIETKEHIEKHRLLLYKYEYLLNLFPELSMYVDDFITINNISKSQDLGSLKKNYDYSRDYLSKEEYDSLHRDERNQLALDNYIKKSKSKWHIGRDYELFCGQYYEKKGWIVEYIGMEKKLMDLGRDLIAKKDDVVHIIQCKYWGKNKIIHEKHIAQLYGTTIVYEIENTYSGLFEKTVVPVFMTNAQLSTTAIRFCEKLGVILIRKKLEEFPRIKCNINGSNRIYHLPFDQQYDRTQINKEGESYAFTVKEAVKKGFRRAYKHFPSK